MTNKLQRIKVQSIPEYYDSDNNIKEILNITNFSLRQNFTIAHNDNII